jgi:ABC-type glutathione transport system ATPase component
MALIAITHDIPLSIRQTSAVLLLNKSRVVQTGATSDVQGTQPSVNGASQLAETTTVKAGGHHGCRNRPL